MWLIPTSCFSCEKTGYDIGHWRKAWGPGDFKRGGYTEHPCGPNSNFKTFMANRDTSKPFCFWFGTSDPHRAYVKDSGAESGIAVDKIHVPSFYPKDKIIQSDIADYYFEVQRWDREVGEAIALLEQAGELDNTIIVMTGDHGMPFPRCKGNLYDWGSHVPLAIRWGSEVKGNRRITDFVSFTDFAPTFLEVAGVPIPSQMTGRSLSPLLLDTTSGRIDKNRDFMVFGRERHTPAQKKPSTQGYPSRALRTDDWLLILNLEPDRWPAGVPEDSTHPMGKFSDCDNGPSKFAIMDMLHDPENQSFYDLCFAKRDAVELYDCQNDPDQINNLAQDPKYAKTLNKLRTQLIDYLKTTEDPRFTDHPVRFDEYRYR